MRHFISPFLIVCLAAFSAGCSTSSHNSDQAASTEAQGATTRAAIWTVDGFKSPEGSYYDPESRAVFVSSMAGGPMDKNHQGWIAQISVTGKMMNPKLVAGLNSPKGMKVIHHVLWITAVDELIGIRLPITARSKKNRIRIKVPGAQCLNSLDALETGTMYVSDTCGDQIFKVENRKAYLFMKGDKLESPNGLLLHGGKLFVTGSDLHVNGKFDFAHATKKGNLYSIDLTTRQINNITRQPLGMLDGLDVDSSGQFIVSDWAAGRVYRIAPDGTTTLLLEEQGNIADISYAPELNVLLVSLMSQNAIKAYLYDKL